MSFTLDRVVLWGRSLEEYSGMFALDEADFRRSIIGCADGPASFNAEMRAAGRTVCSVDPVYELDAAELAERFEASYPLVMEQLRSNPGDYVWTRIPSPEALGAMRRRAMELFLADFPSGREEGRYVAAGLERLPFEDGAFDLALCSHFLFLYSRQLSLDFHLRAIGEMTRVAGEARIFPLLAMEGHASPHLDAVCAHLRDAGLRLKVEKVDHEFQRGGDRMLRIWRPERE